MTGNAFFRATARYCSKLTRLSRSNFYVAFLFLPRKKRNALYAVYAFCRVVDDSVDEAGSAEEKAKRLERWKRALEDAYRGRATHPVMIQLIRTIQEFHLPQEYFAKLIEGVAMDLTHRRYETFDELYHYCYRVASVVGLICIKIFGHRSADIRSYAENLGIALQWTNILRDVGKDAAMGRIYLPLEDLRRFDVSEEEVLQGRMSENFRALMAMECDRAEDWYRKAEKHWIASELPTLFPAEIMKAVYHRILRRIPEAQYDVFHEDISLPAFLKLALACKIYARARLAGS